jgi:hypothetical protein
MIYVKQQDKRLCGIAYCTAKNFLDFYVARNQNAAAHYSSKLQGTTYKIKIERVTRRAALALPGLLRVFGRFAPQNAGVAIMNPGTGWGLQA